MTTDRTHVDVVLVGRAHVDLTVRIPHRPSPGRTAIGSELVASAGGKSLNQAIAVVRLGGRSALVANAGADGWGNLLRTTLHDAGVDLTWFRVVDAAPTGAAIVEITPDGDNTIILAVSPTTELTPRQIISALTEASAPVLVIQLDLPAELVTTALDTSSRRTLRIGNLVPHPTLDRARMRDLDVFVVNHQEAIETLGVDVDPRTSAEQLRRLGPAGVVVTAGADGAAYSTVDHTGVVTAQAVPALDSTGAGDAFLGALALALAHGSALPAAVVAGVEAGTRAVQHHGAQLPVNRDGG